MTAKSTRASGAPRVGLGLSLALLSTLFLTSVAGDAQTVAVSTIAGTAGVAGSADGIGAAAQFFSPQFVVVDKAGIAFVSDSGNNTIRRVDLAGGAVVTVAGRAGVAGSDDGPAEIATFSFAGNWGGYLALDGHGGLFIAQTNCVRKLDLLSGYVSTVAGRASEPAYRDGAGSEARFSFITGLLYDQSGRLLIGDSGNDRVRMLDLQTNVVSTLGGTGTGAYRLPGSGMTADGSGSLYFLGYCTIERQNIATGEVDTVAGQKGRCWGGTNDAPDGSGSDAGFSSNIFGLTFAGAGTLYLTDGNAVRRFATVNRAVATIAGGTSSTWKGWADGSGDSARFNMPWGIAVAPENKVVIADRGNHTIRVVDIGPLDMSTWILPSAASIQGLSGRWTTDLFLRNVGASPLQATLKFLDHDVDGRLGSEKKISVGAGATVLWPDVLRSLFGNVESYGGIRISAPPSLIPSSQTWTQGNKGTFGQSVPLFRSLDLVGSSTRHIVGVAETIYFRTNLVLTNAVETDVAVEVVVVGPTGAELVRRQVPLKPLEMIQLSLSRDLGLVNVSAASIALTCRTSGGGVAAYASVIDNESGDPRTILPR